MAAYLIERWAFGLLTAVVCQQIASRTVEDHKVDGVPQSPSALRMLAGLGADGRHPQNCNRELVTRLASAAFLTATIFLVPMLTLKRREGLRMVDDIRHAMVCPFSFFALLWDHYRPDFARKFLGGVGTTAAEANARLRAWWAAVPDADPRKVELRRALAARDDFVDEDEAWGRAVPINIHGDAFPVSRIVM